MTRRLGPFECEIEALGPRGVGRAVAPDGRRVSVRAAPPGSRLLVVPTARAKSGWTARRLATVRPAAGAVQPQCAQFGLCGGCALQELDLAAQGRHKLQLALHEVGEALGQARVHAMRGAGLAYGYRNKVELSFGPLRWLSEEDHERGLSQSGRFLGFHAPGRFDRLVDAPRCELVSEPMGEVLTRVRRHTLAEGAPPPYDPHTHQGFFRHLLVREAGDQRLVVLYTTSTARSENRTSTPPSSGNLDPISSARENTPLVEALAKDLEDLVVGFQWRLNDGVADVARGEVTRSWGQDYVEETLGSVRFRLGPTSFFQTSTPGARVLYDAVGEALGRGGVLLDLYCGIGSIGLYLAERFERVVGIEENPESVADAVQNAQRNGIPAEFRAARVEAALDVLEDGRLPAQTHVVVDPPRAGLHPSVAARLARGSFASLVYVACNPASLGRDALLLGEGGWRLTDVWPVDLFPQTGHVELVGRFSR
jgi:23S rRNA (uracil1939-C5)-methyltransferase